MSNNTGIDAKIVPNAYPNFSDVFWVPGRQKKSETKNILHCGQGEFCIFVK